MPSDTLPEDVAIKKLLQELEWNNLRHDTRHLVQHYSTKISW